MYCFVFLVCWYGVVCYVFVDEIVWLLDWGSRFWFWVVFVNWGVLLVVGDYVDWWCGLWLWCVRRIFWYWFGGDVIVVVIFGYDGGSVMNYDVLNFYIDDVLDDFDYYDVGELVVKFVFVLKFNVLMVLCGLIEEEVVVFIEMVWLVVIFE